MDLRKLKSKKGFTLIELMVVIVIIGILVAIALPNFISAQDRAKISSTKANLHTLQTSLETYSVDWSGLYPDVTGTTSTYGLLKESTDKKYYKELKNPFGGGKDALTTISNRTAMATSSNTQGNFAITSLPTTSGAGTSIYTPYDTTVSNGSSFTAYNLYGVSKEGSTAIGEKGAIFTLTNG